MSTLAAEQGGGRENARRSQRIRYCIEYFCIPKRREGHYFVCLDMLLETYIGSFLN